MSLTSSLAIRVDAWRRTSPGLSPWRRAAAGRARPRCWAGPPGGPAWASTRPGTFRRRLATSSAFVAQDGQVGPVDAHDDRFARAGQDLLDPLPQVRLHVAVEPGVALDRRMDGGQRRVVVDVGADADPVLAEVHPVDLVGHEGLPDVRAAVADAGDLPEVPARTNGDPGLLGRDVPGLVSQCMRKSRSLKSGSSDCPRVGTPASPASRHTRR